MPKVCKVCFVLYLYCICISSSLERKDKGVEDVLLAI